MTDPRSTVTTLARDSGAALDILKDDRAKRVAISERLAAERTAQLGPDHYQTFWAQSELAIAYLEVERNADAIPVLERLHEKSSAVRGADYRDTLVVMMNLGTVKAAGPAGEFGEARVRTLIQECLLG